MKFKHNLVKLGKRVVKKVLGGEKVAQVAREYMVSRKLEIGRCSRRKHLMILNYTNKYLTIL
ncbi:MAG: hypothetical protein ACTSQE_14975 [Candidatus Heimdallarchaeaceae archaeon]